MKYNATSIQKLTDEKLAEIKLDATNRALIIAELNRRTKTVSNSVQDLFIYPKGIKANSKEGKSLRSKTRNKVNKVCKAINTAIEVNDKEQIKANCKEFVTLYKEFYSLNDYSINSFRRGNSDKLTLMMLNLALTEIKKYVSNKK